MTSTHFVIPDTQCKPGAPTDHLSWVGRYIVEKQPDVIIHLGDHWDLPSLSSYDKGKASFEGRRLNADIEAGNRGIEILEHALDRYNHRRRKFKEKQYLPRKVFLMGNHEDRADRAAENNPELEGFVGSHVFAQFLERRGWEVHPFKAVIDVDGIWYTHMMVQEFTGRAMGAGAALMLKQIGHTFTQGHRQTYDLATRYVGDHMQRALIAGACYLHDEAYKGPSRDVSARSGNHHWRGCVMKHDVSEGEYSLMELPLDFFCRRYEGMSLKEFMGR